MEELKNNNKNLDEQMNCKKEEHFNQQFLFFKFSEKIDEILQCMSCMQEDPQVDKKIIIDQILKFPITKIKNFPPLKNQKDSEEIRKILENFTKEKIEHFKNQVKDQIVEYYKKINKDLSLALQQSQKDVIQQFDDILEFTDISEFYNIESLKNALIWFQNKEINIQQLFEQQLIMKKDFECEKKCQTVLNLEIKQKEILNQIENLKKQLNKKVDIFQEKIQIKTDLVKNYQNQEKYLHLTNPQYFEMNNQQQIQFFNYQQNTEIEIKNNSRRIGIGNQTFQRLKNVYSENLDKNKTYHFKMKINFHQQNKQNVIFYLTGSDEKNTIRRLYNKILITSSDECDDAYGVNRIVQGQRFADFWEDDKTILNVVFNYQEKLFEVYDDQRKGYIKTVIDQNKIKGQQINLGMVFFQCHQVKIDLCILDVTVYQEQQRENIVVFNNSVRQGFSRSNLRNRRPY